MPSEIRMLAEPAVLISAPKIKIRVGINNTDLRKFLDTSVSSISGHIAGATYRAGEPAAQATAQSERIRPWSVANRVQAVSQASMMSARLRNTELASQWLRR